MSYTMSAQHKLDSFYSIDNLVRIEITMDAEKWEHVILKAKPRTPKKDGSQNGSTYDWTTATSVTISGTRSPEKTTFTDVAIRKKSWYGSLSYRKPSLRLNLSKYNSANKEEAKKAIGTHVLTLNNSKQDTSYIRQPLGYELFRQAGVPNLRCNFAIVTVNGQFWGGDPGETEDTPDPRCPPRDGVYINLETVTQKKFVKHQFHNGKGNLYKVTLDSDLFATDILAGYLPFKGFSLYKDQKDILLAAKEIQQHGLAGAKRVVDWDQYMRFLATEILTNNGDGYNGDRNNCYIYNDVKAVSDPKVSNGDINLKFIPVGIDQILPPAKGLATNWTKSVLSKLALANRREKADLYDQIRELADSVFGDKNLNHSVYPFVNEALDMLESANAVINDVDLNNVITQLAYYRSWAYDLVGEPNVRGGLGCCASM